MGEMATSLEVIPDDSYDPNSLENYRDWSNREQMFDMGVIGEFQHDDIRNILLPNGGVS